MKIINNFVKGFVWRGIMNNGFCVILTKYRLPQGVVLCRSLKKVIKNSNNFKMFILCMDHKTYEILSKLNMEDVTLIPVEKVENEELLVKKKERKLNEYCWTLKPVLLEYVLNNYLDIDRVTFLDGDLCFFNDPTPIFHNQAESSVLLSSHKYPVAVKKHHEKRVGKTNSGIVSFKRDETGYECLSWWKEKCLEWCFDKIEDDKFGDQKYLDRVPTLFEGIDYIRTPGVNIAPWNESRYKFSLRGNSVYVNNSKLIVYHFAGFRILNKKEFALTLTRHPSKFIPIIYNPYIRILKKAMSDIKIIDANFNGYFIEDTRRKKVQIYVMDSGSKNTLKLR